MNSAAAVALISSTIICTALMPLLSIYAVRVGLVDHPCDRKNHQGLVPLIGGIAIYLTLMSVMLFTGLLVEYGILLTLCSALLIVGIVDDFISISSKIRLVFQCVIAFAMVAWGDLHIETVGQLMPSFDTNFGIIGSYIFTVLCVIGVINSINMIDGVDGLSGSLLFASFFSLIIFATSNDSYSDTVLLATISGGLLGFLYFNSQVVRPRAAVFLGDSGSTFLGLILVWFFIKFSQGESATMSPVSAGWIFGLPLMDTVSVAARRIVNGQSPFQAGRDHLHHMLLDAGLNSKQTVGVMLTVHIILISIGLVYNDSISMQPILFWGFVLLVLFHFFMTPRILTKTAKQPV